MKTNAMQTNGTVIEGSLAASAMACVIAAFCFASSIQAGVLVQQNFDDNSAPDSTRSTDGFIIKSVIESNAELVFNGTDWSFTGAGRVFDGSGWGWAATWADTRGAGTTGPIVPGNEYDIIGVTNLRDLEFDYGAPSSFHSGALHFAMRSVDGTMTLAFDPLDGTNQENLSLEFSWFATPHQEAGDFFAVVVNGQSLFQRVNGTSNMRNTGNWETIQLDLSQFDRSSQIDVSFVFSSDASDEGVFFDTVSLSGSEFLVGDLNSDGFVGNDDLNIILSNWNLNVPPADMRADPSGDGFIGIDDLNIVLGNWNAGAPPTSGTVPEPTTLGLLLIGSVTLLHRVAMKA